MYFIDKHFVLSGNITSIEIIIFVFIFHVLRKIDFENEPKTGIFKKIVIIAISCFFPRHLC